MTTECIGPDCHSNCNEFIEVKAFPRATHPITGFMFTSNLATGDLIDFAVKVGYQSPTSICNTPPDALSNAEHHHLDVNEPFIGFEYTHDSMTVTSLQMVTNSCSMHGLSTMEIAFDNIPEPIMIQIPDI